MAIPSASTSSPARPASDYTGELATRHPTVRESHSVHTLVNSQYEREAPRYLTTYSASTSKTAMSHADWSFLSVGSYNQRHSLTIREAQAKPKHLDLFYFFFFLRLIVPKSSLVFIFPLQTLTIDRLCCVVLQNKLNLVVPLPLPLAISLNTALCHSVQHQVQPDYAVGPFLPHEHDEWY
ncbi:hypothetical protein BD289DRAFT_117358 [Coniella lustricola]|uniref:Uncharacterized protein n=1 Tax=Coniella lustricola TaxID=2025994 RepID=A0A2T2ZWR3_9PEZI|nr:hypothetical protein BD289DRAFT_117358 [Coniella lustricola]